MGSSASSDAPRFPPNNNKIFPLDNEKYALLVINTYNLENALNDALAQVVLLLHWGFNKSNIVILVDSNQEDSRLDVLENYATIITNNGHDFLAKYNDFFESFQSKIGTTAASLYIAISGHGGQTPDLSGDEFDGLDEFISPAGVIVLDDDLTAPLKSLNANITIFAAVDACHSGTMFDEVSFPPKIIRLSSAEDHQSSGEVYCETTRLVQYLTTLGSSTLAYRQALTVLITGELTAAMVKYLFDEINNNNINKILNHVSTSTAGQNRSTSSDNNNTAVIVILCILLVVFIIAMIVLFYRTRARRYTYVPATREFVTVSSMKTDEYGNIVY